MNSMVQIYRESPADVADGMKKPPLALAAAMDFSKQPPIDNAHVAPGCEQFP